MIDPVDGTYNFHRGLTWWCSAIALRGRRRRRCSARCYHPHDDALFVGGPDLPSTRDGVPLAAAGGPCRLGETVRDARTCTRRTTTAPRIGGVRAGRPAGSATLRMLGSGTMDAMAIAQGQLGVSFQHSVPDWDLAAQAPRSSAASAARRGRVERRRGGPGRWPACRPRWRRSARALEAE